MKNRATHTCMHVRLKAYVIFALIVTVLTLSTAAPALAVNPEPLPIGWDNELYLGYVSGDGAPEVRMMTFDGAVWETLPVIDPQTAPFSPDMTVNPEPLPPGLTMATTVNPEPLPPGSNIMIREYDGVDWTGPTLLPEFTAFGINPAVAIYDEVLFLFWVDTSTTPYIIMGTSDDGTGWAEPGFGLEGEQPTAAVYNDKLYVLWVRDGGLVYRVFDGTTWSEERGQMSPFLINPQPWPIDPLIAVHNGLLYLTYWVPADGVPGVYLHTFDGEAWSGPYPLENPEPSPYNPAICSFNGLLYIFYASNDDLYYQTFDGILGVDGEWSTPQVPTPVPKAVSIAQEVEVTPETIYPGETVTITIRSYIDGEPYPAEKTFVRVTDPDGNPWTVSGLEGEVITLCYPVDFPDGASTDMLGEYVVHVDSWIYGERAEAWNWWWVSFFVIPELPLGTIMALVAPLAAVAGLATIKRSRLKH